MSSGLKLRRKLLWRDLLGSAPASTRIRTISMNCAFTARLRGVSYRRKAFWVMVLGSAPASRRTRTSSTAWAFTARLRGVSWRRNACSCTVSRCSGHRSARIVTISTLPLFTARKRGLGGDTCEHEKLRRRRRLGESSAALAVGNSAAPSSSMRLAGSARTVRLSPLSPTTALGRRASARLPSPLPRPSAIRSSASAAFR